MHIYSFIRRDLPLADQIVQTAHSAYHAGEQFGNKQEIPSLVLLSVADVTGLTEAMRLCLNNGIKFEHFNEPDDNMGITSLTTEPLDGDKRRVFSQFKLWRP